MDDNTIKRMPRHEVEALLKLLAEFEREELALLMWERREAERLGRVHWLKLRSPQKTLSTSSEAPVRLHTATHTQRSQGTRYTSTSHFRHYFLQAVFTGEAGMFSLRFCQLVLDI
jgi:hypothetical protein